MRPGPADGEVSYLDLADTPNEALLASEQGRIRFANPAACRFLGAQESGALSERPLTSIFDEIACARLAAMVEADEPFPALLRRLDGTMVSALVHAKTAPSDSRQQTLSLVPIPPNRPSFDAAWILEAMPVGIVAIDEAGAIQLVNSALERMFGYARDELLDQPVEKLLPKRFRGGHAALRADYRQSPTPRAMGQGRELFALRADGSEFPIEIGLNPIHTPDGAMVLATVADVSERQRVETGFKTLVDAAPYGLIMANGEGRIALVNRMAESLFGYDRAELLGQSIESLLPERYRHTHASQRASFRAAPSQRTMGSGRDLTASHKSGVEVPVEIALTPIEWNDEFMVMAAIADISMRKKLELDLRQANLQLEEFTYVASHDLRSPLRAIADLMDWIEEDLDGAAPDSVKKDLGRVRDRIKRMERLIDDLLKYARASRATTDFTVIDLKVLIANILDMQPPPDGFEVTLKCEAVPFLAAGTPIETVLRNLIGNAFKHHRGERGTLAITVHDEGSYCVITVADDGPGIPALARERVFRMFQSLNSSKSECSGMGLAISKRLVETHGGRIELLSAEPGQGATFRVWWPRFRRKEIYDQQ
jgi:PAS domain S-box-containing protein